MNTRCAFFCAAIAVLLATASPNYAQSLTSVPAISFASDGPVIRAHAEPLKPFTVAGERGVVLGQQDGTFEAWVLPVKLLSHLTIEAQADGYPGTIALNRQAAEIEVRPDRTTITYAHPAFTVRQIMFSPNDADAGTGPVVLFEFDCLRPTSFTFRFTPELRWMWPEPNSGPLNAEWVAEPGNAGGYYLLQAAGNPGVAGAVTIPGAQPGVHAENQAQPEGQSRPRQVELSLHIDPIRDHGRLFPLLMAVGTTPAAATSSAIGSTLAHLNAGIATSYQAHAERYRKLLANSTSIETPDKALNEAFQWAVVSMEQLRAQAPGTGETGLVAGYDSSGDTERPGFGWFFGRDSLYSIYAINGFGDFALSKAELEFLIHRQRADGKIMHEYSQTAAAVDWQSMPFEYAAADSTPLFLMAVEDYVRSSGDTGFLAGNREAIEKAWSFETDPAHDTDHDGIYDNSQGTGWVESWPGAMPHQEIYLALLDQQASAAMAKIEKQLQNPEKSAMAQQRAGKIASTIEAEYYDAEKGCYAFGHNTDGSQDRTSSVYPALAWWDPDGKPLLAHGDECLRQLAEHTLNTDWGLRDISNEEKIYDGASYHQGSVWPLFTGWAALAEYRGGQPLAGYQMLMENANLTWAQDLGADTEWLSGDFYLPMPGSTSHQLWSSAMVIAPTLRGLFGISIDAQTKTITVNPHLPAGWDHAKVKNLRVGNAVVDLSFTQTKTGTLALIKPVDSGIALRPDNSQVKRDGGISISLRPVVVVPISSMPLPGDRTQSLRILSEDYGDRRLTLTCEGLAGREAHLPLVLTTANLKLHAEGAELESTTDEKNPASSGDGAVLIVRLPPGEGWKTIKVTLTW
jgi:glycogen debranching enzyme